jgi:hypothetical protein
MTRITNRDLLAAWASLKRTLDQIDPGKDAHTWALAGWRPGDGITHYRIERDGQTTPFGATYWLGRTEAYYGIGKIHQTIGWMRRRQEARADA